MCSVILMASPQTFPKLHLCLRHLFLIINLLPHRHIHTYTPSAGCLYKSLLLTYTKCHNLAQPQSTFQQTPSFLNLDSACISVDAPGHMLQYQYSQAREVGMANGYQRSHNDCIMNTCCYSYTDFSQL